MLKAEVEHVYRIAHEVAKEEIKGLVPAKATEFDDSALKEEISKLKGEVGSLKSEIKELEAKSVNKKK